MLWILVPSILASTGPDQTPSLLGGNQYLPRPCQEESALTPVDTQTTFKRYGRWQLGLSGGGFTGGGFAIRYWLNETNGLELHGAMDHSDVRYPREHDTWDGDDVSADGHSYQGDTGTVARGEYDFGLAYLHEIWRGTVFDARGWVRGRSHLRFLTFAAVGAKHSFEDTELDSKRWTTLPTAPYLEVNTPYHISTHRTDDWARAGAGGGLEWEIARLSIHMLFGYSMEHHLEPSEYNAGLAVEGGAFVRF